MNAPPLTSIACAGDAARVRRQQPRDDAGDVRGLRHPAERHLGIARAYASSRVMPSASPCRRSRPTPCRVDPARADRVHRHVLAARARPPATARGRAARPSTRCSRCSPAPAIRARIDEITTRWRGSGRAGEMPLRRAQRTGTCRQVRRDEVVEAVVVAGVVRPADAGVRDQHVDRAVRGSRRLETPRDVVVRADVAARGERADARSPATPAPSRRARAATARAPSRASRRAIASPMPVPPPVTTACRVPSAGYQPRVSSSCSGASEAVEIPTIGSPRPAETRARISASS